MDVWGWIVLYVLLFAVLQFLLYRHLRDEESTPLQSAPANVDPTGFEDPRDGTGEDAQVEADADLRQCAHCGTANDTEYTYCRNCVNPLVG